MLLVIVLVQHGNAEKLGNKSSSEYKLSGDFEVITGSGFASETGGLYVTLDFPNGFTATNCVIISFAYGKGNSKITNYARTIVFGLNADTNKIELSINDVSYANDLINYKVVLMRAD